MGININQPKDTVQIHPFTPADESEWFIKLFDLYVRLLFWRKFENVWVQTNYLPKADDRSIYYLNHTSWWDGLIPFLLNQKLFRQNARAMMEDRQMKKHRFFRRIGAFSVNLSDARSSVTSLRYAIKSMQRENASLFIYPEGRIVPFTTEKPVFREGLAWMSSKINGIDIVPVGIYFSHEKSYKPELFIKTGKTVNISEGHSLTETNLILENALQQVMAELIQDAHENRQRFRQL